VKSSQLQVLVPRWNSYYTLNDGLLQVVIDCILLIPVPLGQVRLLLSGLAVTQHQQHAETNLGILPIVAHYTCKVWSPNALACHAQNNMLPRSNWFALWKASASAAIHLAYTIRKRNTWHLQSRNHVVCFEFLELCIQQSGASLMQVSTYMLQEAQWKCANACLISPLS